MESSFFVVDDDWTQLFNILMKLSSEIEEMKKKLDMVDKKIDLLIKQDPRTLNWAIRNHLAVPFHPSATGSKI